MDAAELDDLRPREDLEGQVLDAGADERERAGRRVELPQRRGVGGGRVGEQHLLPAAVLPRRAGAAGAKHRDPAGSEQPLLVGAEGGRDEDAACRQRRVPAGAEHPERAARLPLLGRQRLRGGVAVGVDAHEVPPSGRIGEGEQVAVVRPGRLQDGLAGAAEEGAPGRDPAVDQVAEAELRGVPRHVRVVPRDPGESRPVRRERRLGDEARSADDGDERLGVLGRGAVQRDGHEVAHDPGVGVALPHRQDRAGGSGHEPAEAAVPGRGEGRGVLPGPVEPVQAAVAEVREDHRRAERGPRAPAVVVHGAAHVPGRRQQRLDAVRAASAQRLAALGGDRLRPPDLVADVPRLVRRPAAGRERLGRQRRLPLAVRGDPRRCHATTVGRVRCGLGDGDLQCCHRTRVRGRRGAG